MNDHRYVKKFTWLNTCVYCGQVADTIDHVLPVSVCHYMNWDSIYVWRLFRFGLYKVKCCGECNRIASDKPFTSIKDKRDYIQKKLRKKYAKWLRHVEWTDEEKETLGYSLKADIDQAMINKIITTNRVNYPKKLYPDSNLS